MKTIFASAAALAAMATSAFATGDECDLFGDNCVVSVPEISALEGTAALAVVAAVVLLAWERRRRGA